MKIYNYSLIAGRKLDIPRIKHTQLWKNSLNNCLEESSQNADTLVYEVQLITANT